MLVLSRKQNETIIVTLEDGRLVEITVTKISDEKAYIGVDCDRAIVVRRAEISAEEYARRFAD